MNIDIHKQENNTYKIIVKTSKDEVGQYFEKALKHEAANAEIKGFRKGKAPLNVVRENVNKAELRGHALNHLLTNSYTRVIKENHFKPILQPRFNIVTFEDGKDAEFEMIIIEKPDVKLNDYKSALKNLAKKKQKEAQKKSQKGITLTNQDIINVLLEVCEVGVPEVLVEEEVNRMMSMLIDQTSKLGLTVEQYLQANNKTPEQIRSEYRRSAKSTLKADFLITEVSYKENISVNSDEIEKTIAAVPDEKSREALEKPEQRAYIRAVLTKNKVLQNLVEYAKSTLPSDKPKQDTKKKKDKKKSKSKKSNI